MPKDSQNWKSYCLVLKGFSLMTVMQNEKMIKKISQEDYFPSTSWRTIFIHCFYSFLVYVFIVQFVSLCDHSCCTSFPNLLFLKVFFFLISGKYIIDGYSLFNVIVETNNNVPGVLGLLQDSLVEIGRNDLQENVFDFLAYPLRGLSYNFYCLLELSKSSEISSF